MRDPTWPEIKRFLETNLAQVYGQLERADVPEIYRLQAEAMHCRMLLVALPDIPLEASLRDPEPPPSFHYDLLTGRISGVEDPDV